MKMTAWKLSSRNKTVLTIFTKPFGNRSKGIDTQNTVGN